MRRAAEAGDGEGVRGHDAAPARLRARAAARALHAARLHAGRPHAVPTGTYTPSNTVRTTPVCVL